MKKSLATVVLTALALLGIAQAPDTTVFGGGVVHHIVGPYNSFNSCWVRDCPFVPAASYFVEVVVQDTFNAIEVGTELFTDAHVSVKVNNGTFSILDTCGQFWAPDGIYLRDTLKTGDRFILHVETDNSAMPGIYIRFDGMPNPVPTTFTPCTLTGVPGPGADRKVEYRRWIDGSVAHPPLEPGYYFERDATLPGRPRIIRVVEDF